MGSIIRIAWDRFQLAGQCNGDYVARGITFLMYATLLIPFALIARFLVDPLELRKRIDPHWRERKPVGVTIEEARSQF